MIEIENSQRFYQFQIFKKFPDVIQVISTKKFGNTKFDSNFKVNQNFRNILLRINSNFDYVNFQQVHRSKIAEVRRGMFGKILPGFDGGVTTLKTVLLAVFVADCYPILAFEPRNKIIGVAHAGWRGIKAQIAKNLILKMKKLGAKSEDIVVGLGPGICLNHLEIKDDIAGEFNEKFLTRKNKRIFLDLEKAIIVELQESGIKPNNIETASICVFENQDFFSYRREKTDSRFVALLGLRKDTVS